MPDRPGRVGFLIASLESGGIQTATVRLVREFVRRGYEIDLVVVNAHGPLRADVPAGCRLVDLDCRRARQALPRLARYLQAEKPATLISAQTHINILALLARALIGYPQHLIICEHIALAASVRNSRSLLEKLRPPLVRRFYPLASRVVAVSNQAAQDLRTVAGLRQEVQVIHNGIDIEEIRLPAGEASPHAWFENSQLRVVLGIGRLAPQKNFGMLLRAFAALPPANHRLIVLGEGPELRALEVLAEELGISERVNFPGFVKNPFAYLARSNVFVLSSKWEGFANVVLEALACGAPIVATDCPGGPADILANTGFGELVPVDDVPAMTEAIQRALDSKPDRRGMMEYAKSFSIQTTADLYIGLLESLR